MLQNKFELPLDLEVKSSKIFHIYQIIIFVLSILGIFYSSLTLTVQLFLCVVLCSFSALVFKKKNISKITSLKLTGDDKWELEINSRYRFDAELHGECVVTHFLVWLNFTTSNSFGRRKVFHLLLLPDSADKDLLRKLRVRLRFLKIKL